MVITAGMVKALREKTGLPMMDCKKALVEANGDMDKAIEILRKKGLAKVDKMRNREAGEGRIACHIDDGTKRAGMVELRCETAPVANTDDFIKLAATIAKHVALTDAPDVETIRDVPLLDDASQTLGDHVNDVFNRIRENIQIARVAQMSGEVGHYVHFDGKKGAMVELSGACPDELSAGVCMHVTAMAPQSLRREDVAADEVEQQKQEFSQQAQGKPEQVIEKIVTGKLNRWYSEFVLLDQPYVKDDKKSVGAALAEAAADLTIKRFVRFQVGV